MKDIYIKPKLEEQKIEIEDVIASSSMTKPENPNGETGWLPWV